MSNMQFRLEPEGTDHPHWRASVTIYLLMLIGIMLVALAI